MLNLDDQIWHKKGITYYDDKSIYHKQLNIVAASNNVSVSIFSQEKRTFVPSLQVLHYNPLVEWRTAIKNGRLGASEEPSSRSVAAAFDVRTSEFNGEVTNDSAGERISGTRGQVCSPIILLGWNSRKARAICNTPRRRTFRSKSCRAIDIRRLKRWNERRKMEGEEKERKEESEKNPGTSDTITYTIDIPQSTAMKSESESLEIASNVILTMIPGC